MSGNSLKTHYTAKELAELSLACLPKTKQGVLYQAKKQGWTTHKKVGVGGEILEFELSNLPQEIQTEIRSRFMSAVVEAKPLCVRRWIWGVSPPNSGKSPMHE